MIRPILSENSKNNGKHNLYIRRRVCTVGDSITYDNDIPVGDKTQEGEFYIPEWAESRFDESMGKLQAKCEKLGVGFLHVEKLGTFKVPKKKQVQVWNDAVKAVVYAETSVMMDCIKVKVWGDAPIVKGWRFIASIDFYPVLMVNKLPGTTETIPPEYITGNGKNHLCDHCHTERQRSKAYVIINEAGEWKQVGSTCIKDFTGHVSPEALARYWEMVMKLPSVIEEGNERGWGGTGGYYAYDLDEVIYTTIGWIRKHGYVSRQMAEDDHTKQQTSTGVRWLLDMAHSPNDDNRAMAAAQYPEIYPIDIEQTKEIIDWARNIPDSECNKSDYLLNIRALARIGKAIIYPQNRMSLAVSMVKAYERAHPIEQKPIEEAKSQYLAGNIGDRITVEGAFIRNIRQFETNFGTTTMYRLEKDGNVIVWFASKDVVIDKRPLQVADTVNVKGTIKKFDEYRGTKQTVLTRCKVTLGTTGIFKGKQPPAEPPTDAPIVKTPPPYGGPSAYPSCMGKAEIVSGVWVKCGCPFVSKCHRDTLKQIQDVR